MKIFGCKAATNSVELLAAHTINYLINEFTRKLPQIKQQLVICLTYMNILKLEIIAFQSKCTVTMIF